MNQQCEQYGKMLCGACVVEMPVMGDRSRQELVEAEKPGYHKPSITDNTLFWVFFVTAAALFGAGLYFGLPWWGAAIGGLVLSGIFAYWLSSFQEWVPAVPAVFRTVTENVEIGRSKCCIACRQAVQHR